MNPDRCENKSMNDRNCYCPTDGKQPTWLTDDNIPLGFCGICDDCGEFGHTRHYPGPVPFTGSWCDTCYEKEKLIAKERLGDE